MIFWMYTVWDSKAKAYLLPVFAMNDEVAIRNFERDSKNPDHMFYSNGEDFSLWKRGSFDQANGDFIECKLECIGKAHELGGSDE